MEWWWCLVTCSRAQVVLERSCGCGWVGGLINGTHKCYNMIMMQGVVTKGLTMKGGDFEQKVDSSYNNFFPLVLSMVKEKKKI